MPSSNPDFDIEFMDRVQLKDEIRKLRKAIREQRDQKSHNLPELWDVLPEKIQPQPEVPEWCEFMQQCAAFRKSLDEKHG